MLISVRPEFAQPDIAVIDDVLVHDCYRVVDLPSPVETAIDVGSHIGAFAARLLWRFPRCRLVCVEANSMNEEALRATLRGTTAEVEISACYYGCDEVELLNTLVPGGSNTGGSFVQPIGSEHWNSLPNRYEYQPAGRCRTVTIETLMGRYGFERLDLLKLDCEGSEMNIFEHAPLERIGCIVGEWHDGDGFPAMVARHFKNWTFDVLRDDTPGLFRLSRQDWWNMK